MSKVSLDPIRRLLAEVKRGKIPSDTIPLLTDELVKVWNELSGATEERMEARKLDRGSDWTWHPPMLSFLIERHGATVPLAQPADQFRSGRSTSIQALPPGTR